MKIPIIEPMKSVFIPLIALFIAPCLLGALQPSFTPLDLSSNNQLLFTCKTEQPGWGEFETALSINLAEQNDLELLTYFPEQSTYYPSVRELEILNRFGLFRSNIDTGYKFHRIPLYSSLLQEERIQEGRILPTATSPDGRWILFQERTDPIRGNLILYDKVSKKKTLISSNHVLEYRSASALWSPDSRYLVYSRDNRLFFMGIHLIEESRVPDESYREFGKGSLESVHWVDSETLFYINDSMVNQIRPSELSTFSFYTDPLPNGKPLAQIPIGFDPASDRFWPSPNGKSLAILKDNHTLFRFPFSLPREYEHGQAFRMPFLLLPKKMTVLQLWWRGEDIVLLAGGSQRNQSDSLLYVFDENQKKEIQFELQTDLVGVRSFVPSPDGNKLAVLLDTGISLRYAESFRQITFFPHPDPRNFLWVDDNRVLIVGANRIESMFLNTKVKSFVSLSSLDELGFSDSGEVVSVSDGRSYRWDSEIGRWNEIGAKDAISLRTPSLETHSFRVYQKETAGSSYSNQIMVRTVKGFGNKTLFKAPEPQRVALPSGNDNNLPSALDERVFDHGSRTRRREISLVFNAIDNDEGLGEILSVLEDFDIRATFFLSGDFIRGNPESTRILADSGHEIGSLFYTHMDMADYRYRIDKNFVVRGLGRNEDEYFNATKKEISTMWHAPWYVVSPPVLDGTQQMNYLYVGRDIDPLDWVTLDSPRASRELYKSSLQLVEEIIDNVKPGSIVPIRLGKPGKRKDYLFRKLDLLINGLIRRGYDIVTAGELKEHSL